MRVAGLFAGIGGVERGLSLGYGPADVELTMMCEWWAPAQAVLRDRFGVADLRDDVRMLGTLPGKLDLLTAGFPCTDLSQAGKTAGIHGDASGLVMHVFEALAREKRAKRGLPTLLIENVVNMLSLGGGGAMAYLVAQLEDLGYRWAYRTVDSRFTGVPQRRRRVILLASTRFDPATVLFADNARPRDEGLLNDDAYGFYWTEGRRGLGWAVDAVPTLKGGSTIGIASPPAIWVPENAVGRQFVSPTIEDAEVMQGFPRGWTTAGATGKRGLGARWKLVGNAVTVGVSEWVGSRLKNPGDVVCEMRPRTGKTWPLAACGAKGSSFTVDATEWPLLRPAVHLTDVVDVTTARSLSEKAVTGFHRRLNEGNLGRHPGFREALTAHLEHIGVDPEAQAKSTSGAAAGRARRVETDEADAA